MSWNIHHTTLLSAAAGFVFGKQCAPTKTIDVNKLSLSSISTLYGRDFNSNAFKIAFIGLNLASGIYDTIPHQKTLVITKQVPTTDDEENTYNTKVTEEKQYNVTQFNIDSMMKLYAVMLSLLMPEGTMIFSAIINIKQGLLDITGISDYFTNIHANEINSHESISIL